MTIFILTIPAMTNIRSEKIVLRAPEPEDIDFIYALENNPDIWEFGNTLVPFSRYTLREYLQTAHLDVYTNKQARFIVECTETSEPVGAIDIFEFDPYHNRAGIGVVINNTNNRKKGYAKESLKLLLNYCFNTLLLNQVYCTITHDNEASLNLFKSVGFEITGKKIAWIKTASGYKDEYTLQYFRDNYNDL